MGFPKSSTGVSSALQPFFSEHSYFGHPYLRSKISFLIFLMGMH
jgi:hypothetical protein